jgi:hypothetical protein
VNVDCKKAQRLCDDVSEGRLADSVAREVQRHIQECTDCRVYHQRVARLQQLFALKRYEKPSPQYFDNFLANFHRRLEEQLYPALTPWSRLVGAFSIEPVRNWRYSFAGAMGFALAVAFLWRGVENSTPPAVSPSGAEIIAQARPFTNGDLPASRFVPTETASTLPSSPRASHDESVQSPVGSIVIIPATARPEVVAPRYVLDRITMSPASYEVASVNF